MRNYYTDAGLLQLSAKLKYNPNKQNMIYINLLYFITKIKEYNQCDLLFLIVNNQHLLLTHTSTVSRGYNTL